MNRSFLLLLPFLLALALGGCRKDSLFTDDRSAKLELTEDTVLFDTVFTTVGTVTKRFTVHNRNANAVRVKVTLQGGTPSPFRINVDGLSGVDIPEVEILGRDSAYVFVEATLDPNNAGAPMVIEDWIVFLTNGNEQKVLLVAWGQDAHHYHNIQGQSYGLIAGGTDPNGDPICETVDWYNDKPYLIYGRAAVDSCSVLRIHPGVRVYFHGSSGLWVYRYGRIQAQGTVEDPITFQGDRLEAMYADLPGQWDRIWIMEGDADNEFTNCRIKNALVGIQAETAPWLGMQPTSSNRLVLDNVTIRNSSAAGLLTRNYRVTSTNLLVANAGQYCVALTGGGAYHFNHTTIANYWSYDIRQEPAFHLSDLVGTIDGVFVGEIESSEFQNGIIYGNNINEFMLDLEGQALPINFHHWLFRTDQNTTGSMFTTDIYRNQNPGFVNPSEGDLHLSANAFARNKGIATDAIFDLDGLLRGDGMPDLGCYEAE